MTRRSSGSNRARPSRKRFDGVLQGLSRPAQLGLARLRLGDVPPGGDEAALAGLAVGIFVPAPFGELELLVLRDAALGDLAREPFLEPIGRGREQAALGPLSRDLGPGRAGHEEVLGAGVELLVLGIAQHQPVGGVVEHEPLGQGFDRVLQVLTRPPQLSLALALLGQVDQAGDMHPLAAEGDEPRCGRDPQQRPVRPPEVDRIVPQLALLRERRDESRPVGDVGVVVEDRALLPRPPRAAGELGRRRALIEHPPASDLDHPDRQRMALDEGAEMLLAFTGDDLGPLDRRHVHVEDDAAALGGRIALHQPPLAVDELDLDRSLSDFLEPVDDAANARFRARDRPAVEAAQGGDGPPHELLERRSVDRVGAQPIALRERVVRGEQLEMPVEDHETVGHALDRILEQARIALPLGPRLHGLGDVDHAADELLAAALADEPELVAEPSVFARRVR